MFITLKVNGVGPTVLPRIRVHSDADVSNVTSQPGETTVFSTPPGPRILLGPSAPLIRWPQKQMELGRKSDTGTRVPSIFSVKSWEDPGPGFTSQNGQRTKLNGPFTQMLMKLT